MVIWEFPLEVKDIQTIKIPSRYTILSCQLQDGIPTIWVIAFDPDYLTTNVEIHFVETGNEFNFNVFTDGTDYISTIQLDGFVWHIFGIIKGVYL